MSFINDAEKSLDDIFVKKAPKLPESAKKFIVQYLPWINLALGILTLWAAWGLWNWAHIANAWVDYANSISRVYGTGNVVGDRLTISIWLSLIVLAIEAVLYIAAFPGTKAKKKSGWNLLFYALIVNVAYSVVLLFTAYGGFGNLLGGLIGTTIGLYFLFQIRSSYS